MLQARACFFSFVWNARVGQSVRSDSIQADCDYDCGVSLRQMNITSQQIEIKGRNRTISDLAHFQMKRYMHIFAITFLTIAGCVSQSHAYAYRFSSRLPEWIRANLRRRLKSVGGCNANVCFAVDGSSSISRAEFENEKNFVLDVASVISMDQPVELAAAQYSTSIVPITPLTPYLTGFDMSIWRARQIGGASFVVGGVNYCFSQLMKRPREANQMVILGDGRSNIGSDAVKRAALFRRLGGSLSTVAAGFADDRELLAIAGNDRSMVFRVNSFADVLALHEIIKKLVFRVCGH